MIFYVELENDRMLRVEIIRNDYVVAIVHFTESGISQIKFEDNPELSPEEVLQIIRKIEPIATDFIFFLSQQLLRLPSEFEKALA